MSKYRCFFVLLFLVYSITSFAQSQEYFRPGKKAHKDYYTKFDILTTEEGLSNNFVRVIYQDKYGYMWFGTVEGLNKYDGYQISVYKNMKNDSNSLSDNYINDITEDADGNLWIATNNGLNLYDREHDNFIKFFTDSSTANSLQNNNIKALLSDTSGFLWIDTYNGFLHKLSIKDFSFEFFKYSSRSSKKYPIYSLYADNNKIWILYMGGNTAIFDKVKKSFSYLKDREIIIEGNKNLSGYYNYQSTMIKDNCGCYYFGTPHAFGSIYNSNTNVSRALGLPSIYTSIKDNKGNIWLGGYSVGLLKYNIKSNILTQFKQDQNNFWSLPSNQIWDIFYDRGGNVWIGTSNGIAKLSYATNKFMHIRKIAGNKNTIISNNIKDVIQTKDSNIWIASFDGLSCYNIKTNSVSNIQHQENSKNTLIDNHIKAIYQDKEETLWLGLWSGKGFNRYDIKTKTFKPYVFNPDGRGSDWYVGFAEDHYGKFYTSLWGSDAMAIFDRDKRQFANRRFRSDASLVYGDFKNTIFYKDKIWYGFVNINQIDSIGFIYTPQKYKKQKVYARRCADPKSTVYIDVKIDERVNDIKIVNNNLYFATQYGLLKYKNENEDIIRITKRKYDIRCISKSIDSSTIWIVTNDGLFLLNRNTGKELLKINSETSNGIIKDNYFSSLMLDNEGILWAVAKTKIYKITLNALEKAKFKIEVFNEKLSSNKITDIVQDKESRIWIATENGLNSYDSKTNTVRQYFKSNSKLKSDFINCLFVDSSGDIWIGGEKGLAKYDREKNDFETWQYDPMNPNTLSNNRIFSISETNNNVLILGTNSGVCNLDIKTGKVFRYNQDKSNKIEYSLSSCIFTDSKGKIWRGTDGGKCVDRYDPSTETIRHFTDYTYEPQSYKGDVTNFVFEDSKGIIWIGSDKGLNKFDSIKQNFKLYNIDNGFPSNNIFGMLEDDNGIFWVSTSIGLVKFSSEKGVLNIFNKNDGISSNNFEPDAFCKLFDGRLVFGSDNGLTVFHPDSIRTNNTLVNPLFTRFYIYDSLVNADLSNVDEIELNYTQNNFYFEFSANDYLRPNKLKYAYKLEGYDPDWIYTDAANRKAKYTSLPYGNYILKLKASNVDGIWNDKPVSIRISITPPLWQTTYAYILYFILAIGGIYVLMSYRTKKIKHQNAILEKTVKERTKEIIEKNEKIIEQKLAEELKQSEILAIRKNISEQEELRLRIASELHDGVGGSIAGVKLFIENILIERKIPELKRLLHDLDNTYNLVRNISHDLIPPEFEIASLMEILQVYIEQIEKRSDLEIFFSAHPNTGWSNLDKSLQVEIYRVIQEILTNAIKHANATEIELQIMMHSDYISILIEDNGGGFSKEVTTDGIGLRSLKNRINSRHGNIEIDSVIGRGTIINIEIPKIEKN